MKKLIRTICLTLSLSALITALSSCGRDFGTTGTSASDSSEYTYYTSFSVTEEESSGELLSEAEEHTTAENESITETTKNDTPPSTANQPSSKPVPPSTSRPPVTATQAPPAEKTTKPPDNTNVDLSIDVPSANGKMEVDTSRGNKFTVIVSDERKIDAAYLVAVYSVPDSGQNYVFEFTSKTGRTEDDIRRVYLIDQNGKITGVAAKKASERENITAVENWFCINVLIKKLLFPAIEKELG